MEVIRWKLGKNKEKPITRLFRSVWPISLALAVDVFPISQLPTTISWLFVISWLRAVDMSSPTPNSQLLSPGSALGAPSPNSDLTTAGCFEAV
jgi:hypothetical protein